MKYREIYDICVPEKKRKEERFNIFASAIGRPISIIITKWFINTGVKPTTITKWSIVCCLIGFFILCFSTALSHILIGWLFFFAWNILDGVDGNLARCKKQCSILGDLWDTMGGYIAMILTYFSAGVMAYYNPQMPLYLDHSIFLILGCATSVISIFPRLMMHKRKSSTLKEDISSSISDKNKFGLSQIIAMNLISPSGFMQIIFLLSMIFRLLNYYIVFYFVINTGIMLISLRKILK